MLKIKRLSCPSAICQAVQKHDQTILDSSPEIPLPQPKLAGPPPQQGSSLQCPTYLKANATILPHHHPRQLNAISSTIFTVSDHQ